MLVKQRHGGALWPQLYLMIDRMVRLSELGVPCSHCFVGGRSSGVRRGHGTTRTIAHRSARGDLVQVVRGRGEGLPRVPVEPRKAARSGCVRASRVEPSSFCTGRSSTQNCTLPQLSGELSYRPGLVQPDLFHNPERQECHGNRADHAGKECHSAAVQAPTRKIMLHLLH